VTSDYQPIREDVTSRHRPRWSQDYSKGVGPDRGVYKLPALPRRIHVRHRLRLRDPESKSGAERTKPY